MQFVKYNYLLEKKGIYLANITLQSELLEIVHSNLPFGKNHNDEHFKQIHRLKRLPSKIFM